MNDPHIVNKVTNMLAKLLMSNKAEEPISMSLPKRNACKVGKRRTTKKEFKMSLYLGGFEMKDVMLDLGEGVNILLKNP